MRITPNGNIIYVQCNDYCVIGTMNILETISKMTSSGRTLVEHDVEKDDSSLLFFAKGDLLSKLI